MRIGVIGAGRIGALHAANLRSCAGVDEVVVFDGDTDRSHWVADQIGGSAAGDVAEILERSTAVVIATPTPTHAEFLLQCVAAGLPVLCEKPISLDLATTDEVVTAVHAADAFVQVGFQRRFDSGFARARAMVDADEVGQIYVVRMAGHDADPPPAGYLATSGGIFADLHIHEFDAVRWVTGAEIEDVYATGSVLVTDEAAACDDVDVSGILMRLSNGAVAVTTGTRADPGGYDHRLEIVGSRAAVSVAPRLDGALHELSGGERPPGERFGGFIERFADAYRAEAEAFVAAVARGLPSPATVDDARAALLAALAATRSCREHRPVAPAELAPAGIGTAGEA